MLTPDDLPWPELGNVSRGATRGNQGRKGVSGLSDCEGRCILQLRVQPGVLAVRLNRKASEWYRIFDNKVNRALKLTKMYWRKARRQDYDARADQDQMKLHERLQQLKDKVPEHDICLQHDIISNHTLSAPLDPLSNLPQIAETQPVSGGILNNCQNLVVNSPHIVTSIQERTCVVMHWLALNSLSGVEFDSSSRHPRPTCYPGTRLTILKTIHDWFCDGARSRRSRLLWLTGPAGVGKSAIIQTLSEILSLNKVLVATLFFSRAGGHNDLSRMVTTIAYQLAVDLHSYRQYLQNLMDRNPRVLEKGLREQFEALIVEPLARRRLAAKSGVIPIFLDGLNECKGDSLQVTVIQLISQFTITYPDAPFSWVITSRPEPHIQLAFQSCRISPTFWELTISIGSPDSCNDVEQFLRGKANGIRNMYSDMLPPGLNWLTATQFSTIARASSGFFFFADTVIKFLEEETVWNPIAQLGLILPREIDDILIDPLVALHQFYATILKNVPKARWPTTYKLLGYALFWNLHTPQIPYQLSLLSASIIFRLDAPTVYGALRKINSVISFPSRENCGSERIQFYHTSFTSYLCSPIAAEAYVIDLDGVSKDLYQRYSWIVSMDTHEGLDFVESTLKTYFDNDSISIDGREIWESLYHEALCFFTHSSLPMPSPPLTRSTSQRTEHSTEP